MPENTKYSFPKNRLDERLDPLYATLMIESSKPADERLRRAFRILQSKQ